ncbi:hypothetical protein CYY_006210 [Polysphondylium violaceum]|uniref:Uracil-DNA glycosylase n=1 Tax=Polysphondylium violaceum TaxID=133409 RepID=A0A8J4UZ48_9MYCE|nr:hypothetical protein CYY_006210 [Polysphondylium violaceum]
MVHDSFTYLPYYNINNINQQQQLHVQQQHQLQLQQQLQVQQQQQYQLQLQQQNYNKMQQQQQQQALNHNSMMYDLEMDKQDHQHQQEQEQKMQYHQHQQPSLQQHNNIFSTNTTKFDYFSNQNNSFNNSFNNNNNNNSSSSSSSSNSNSDSSFALGYDNKKKRKDLDNNNNNNNLFKTSPFSSSVISPFSSLNHVNNNNNNNNNNLLLFPIEYVSPPISSSTTSPLNLSPISNIYNQQQPSQFSFQHNHHQYQQQQQQQQQNQEPYQQNKRFQLSTTEYKPVVSLDQYFTNTQSFSAEIKSSLLEPGWRKVLEPEFSKDYFVKLCKFLEDEKESGGVISPKTESIFRCFNLTPFDKVKVVILGQDPPSGNQANGLAFSVDLSGTNKPIPSSLSNILTELQNDLGVCKNIKQSGVGAGNLEKWAHQGVLLLNSSLTMKKGSPDSHSSKGWEQFTDAAISLLCSQKKGIIFFLWGKLAQQKIPLIQQFNYDKDSNNSNSNNNNSNNNNSDIDKNENEKDKENIIKEKENEKKEDKLCNNSEILNNNNSNNENENNSETLISDKHIILTASHPSPFSAPKGFFGCKHFSIANNILVQSGRTPIDWDLDSLDQ